MAEKAITDRFNPANPNSYRTFSPWDIEESSEHGPFQAIYDAKNALEALAQMIVRARTSFVDEMPNEFEQAGVAYIVKSLAMRAHDAAAWIEDHYEPKKSEEVPHA